MANEHSNTPQRDQRFASEQTTQISGDSGEVNTASPDTPTQPGISTDEIPGQNHAAPDPSQNHAASQTVTIYNQSTPPQPGIDEQVTQVTVPPTQAPVIAVRDLRKTYVLGKKTEVQALRGVSLDVYPGEFVAIMGPSGSGKSTFMNLLGCLDRPSQGEYWLDGRLVSRLSSDDLASMRNRLIGFVFQGFNLLGRS
ncbi:MAG: ABC transporter ATP-binding protein, partial [Ktedonobacteraceae bacterium]|nr:ABC transporter ATP-binding protein [Ktedonobacteraceae bacterium]